jgi:hypothetical protein
MSPKQPPHAWKSLTRFSLAAFLAIAAQLVIAPISFGDPGDLYVTDLGTRTGDGSVIIYKPDGTPSTLVSGLQSPQGITFDQSKNLFVADAGDGSAGAGKILSIDHITGDQTVLVQGLFNPIGLAIDGSDLIVSENGLNRVLRVVIETARPSVFKLVENPLGAVSQFTVDGLHNSFIANGSSVVEVGDTNMTYTIPGAFGVEATTISLGDVQTETVFVSTTDGTIRRILNGNLDPNPVASGITDPRGMAYRSAHFSMNDTGDLFVADGNGGRILIVDPGVPPVPFASEVHPNFLVFEVEGTPTPSPTPTPSASPTPSTTPTPTPTGSPTPTPSPVAPKLLNLSSRVDVQTGDDVAIAGLIINGGTQAKTVLVRAIGPSLANNVPPVMSPLADPILELHDSTGATIAMNDSWMTNSAEDQGTIVAGGYNMYAGQTISDLEPILIATLQPKAPAGAPADDLTGEYTAILRGSDGGTGIGLLEVYDLDDPSAEAELANISTRGIVGTADTVLIGGLSVGPDQGGVTNSSVVVRAIGPSLAGQVATPLADPFVQLFNSDGDNIGDNDNWMDDPNADLIQSLGLAPTDDLEAAVFANLTVGQYTAIVMGSDGGVGDALVEIYHVATPTGQ